MSLRTASVLSVILSLLLLFILAVLSAILELVVMNGATESQGMTAIGVSLACLSMGAILLGVLAWKTTGFLITSFNMNPILAVTLTVGLGLLVGGAIAIGSILLSIPLAGIH